jgi:hypothetical protein
MSDNGQPEENSLQAQKTSPAGSKPVWVQCETFRCMARQDANGKWRTFFGDNELTTFVSVIDDQPR